MDELYVAAEGEALARRARDGRIAMDLAIEEYLSLGLGDPRRAQLTRVISVLSFPDEVRKAS
ncbi:MAG TPA: hypothetical protein VFE03_03635 [Caulobacteraceae bacterium]|jgi:hypothetical protein|nr:hypothetical protein [Caulobacteraceae bacterium]